MNPDDELTRAHRQAQKARSDFIEGLWAFLGGVAIASDCLDEWTEEGTANRFLNALEVAGERFAENLPADGRAQYRKIYQYFQEVLGKTSPSPD